MVLIGISLVFLVIGVWEHGRKLAILLFLCFLALGVFGLRDPELGWTPSLAFLERARSESHF